MQPEVLRREAKRQLASVRAIVDEGHIVVFGPQESYLDNTSTGVFVAQFVAQAGSSTTKKWKVRRAEHELRVRRFSGRQREPKNVE